MTTLLGNGKIAEACGTLVNKNLSTVMQTLVVKFIQDEKVALVNNEIVGIELFEWEKYPEAFFVDEKKYFCGNLLADESMKPGFP